MQNLKYTKSKDGITAKIKHKEGITKPILLSAKSKWAILRNQFGRVIDTEIESQKNELKHKFNFDDFFMQNMTPYIKKQKTMQYITIGNKAIAVASKKHSLMGDKKIKNTIINALKENKIKFDIKDQLNKIIIYFKQNKLMKMGLQISTGDIATFKAIHISYYAEICACMNPLSFLNLNKSIFMLEKPPKTRILRFASADKNLPVRLQYAINNMKPYLSKLNQQINSTKKIDITPNQAKNILIAMCYNYEIGSKTAKAVIERFEEEPQTLYGLSMAASWIVEHNPEIFRKSQTKASQNLSTIAGAILLVRNVRKTNNFASEFLDSNKKTKKYKEMISKK